MYKIIKTVLESGRFELSDILRKIDTYWLQSDLSDEQKEELVALAREKAKPENSYADLQKQIDALFARVAALEEKSAPQESTENEYPEYVQPTGGHDAYYNGDKVTFNGVKYVCIAPISVAVVWSPDVYPAYWSAEVE